MSDEEDYNSEEDLDYVPSEGEQASEEENSGDEEDLSLLKDDDTESKGTAVKQKTRVRKINEIKTRKRRGGIKLDEKNGDGPSSGITEAAKDENEEEANRRKELAEQIAIEEENKKKEKEKKRADELWSSFMSDVKRPVSGSSCSSSSLMPQVKPSNGGSARKTQEVDGTGKGGKVTITKVFDFAGEEVMVTKEVDADSKEAKAEQKKQEKDNQEMLDNPTQTGPPAVGTGTKRPAVGGLGNLLNKITKRNKMGTLEKSKIDWETFKKREGIDEDLKIHNKGKQGYTERMAFLNRADQREYEIERDLRLGSTSKR